MAQTVNQVLEEAKRILGKRDAFLKKAAPAMEGIDSMPGAEKDSPVDSSAGKSDKEVKQERPAGVSEGKGLSDAEGLESGHAKSIDQPSDAKITKEPLTTSDAGAEPKTGSVKHANDFLRNVQEFLKRAEDGETEEEEKKEEKSEDKNKKDKSEEVGTTIATPPKAIDEQKSADVARQNIELTQDALAKIGAVVLATEGGYEYAEKALSKQAGAETARMMISTLHKQAEYARGMQEAERILALRKQAEYDAGANDAEQLIAGLANRQQKQASQNTIAEKVLSGLRKQAAEREALVKQAEFNAGAVDAMNFINDYQAGKIPQEEFNKVAQAVADAVGGEEALAQMAGIPAEGGEMGGAMPAEGGAEGEVSVEELLALIQQLPPEEQEAIIQYLMAAEQAGGEAGDPAGLAPEQAGAGDEAGQPAESDMEVMASVSDFNERLKQAMAAIDAPKK